MTDLEVRDFVDALADERMLEPDQYELFISTMLPVCDDVHILAREMVYRGWLTPFQVERILSGHAKSLMFGSYVLIEPLGEGGMGRVFRARNWKLNRLVALKIIGSAQARRPSNIARFQREIRALGRIRHPNIVLALDADSRPGVMYYAMEYFDGKDLGRYVNDHGPLLIADACNFMMQTADAIQHAYEQGLIHRDIKPSNLLLTEPDHIIKLLDLGLTRCEVPMNDSAFIELTRAGAIIGTPDYMSPEQIRDSRGADIRSDLYSLGCTFYYLLTGMAPFQNLDAIVDKLYAHCETEPTPIEELRPDTPPDVAAIIHRLMAKHRRDRFQTPGEVAELLQEFLSKTMASSTDTRLDVKPITLADTPAPASQAREPDRTLELSQEELKLVHQLQSSSEQRKPKRRRIVNPSFFVFSILIITLAMLMIWRKSASARLRHPPLSNAQPASIEQTPPFDAAITRSSGTTQTVDDSAGAEEDPGNDD